MSATPDSTLANPEQRIADLERQLADRDAQKAAMAEVLSVINSSAGDLKPVFDAILEKAHNLCGSAYGSLQIAEGDAFRAVAVRGMPEAFANFIRHPLRPGPNHPVKELIDGAAFAMVINSAEIDDPIIQNALRLGGMRTGLFVPLRKESTLLGYIVASRPEVRPFSDEQIALLQNFAAQAVIAMENARLITEAREALKQQTATAEVLGVINSSPGDLKPVFDAILEKAHTLCGAAHGSLMTYDGEFFRAVALHDMTEPLASRLREPFRAAPGDIRERLLQGERLIHIPDIAVSDQRNPESKAALDAGVHTLLIVPLRKNDVLLGYITANRREVRPFTDKEIALLENFAAQAVIAMENARLITETREALEQQTATAEVLQVINSSPSDLAPVFDTMLEKAMALCGAAFGIMATYDGTNLRPVAMRGIPPRFAAFAANPANQPGPGGATPRLAAGAPFVHVADLKEEEAYWTGDPYRRALVDVGEARSLLAVPLRKDGVMIGQIGIYRQEVRPYTDRQIALLQNFAAQAVIAMENARLLTETREALDQQTATAEVLQVINASPGNLAPVFDAILVKAHTLCDAPQGALFLSEGDDWRAVATHGGEGVAERMRQGFRGSDAPPSRPLLAGEPFVHITDLAEIDHPLARAAVKLAGARTVLSVPLRKGEALLGMILATRREVLPFTDKQIALLQNFAAQAIIAMENARLITETQEALDQQTATAEVLGVINSSPGDLGPVFTALLQKAHALCDTSFGALMVYDGDQFRPVASQGVPEPFRDLIGRGIRPKIGDPFGHMVEGAPLSHIHDLAEVVAEHPGAPLPRAAVDLGGIRTFLIVPLRKDNALLGVITAYRQEVRPFTDKQIALLQSFAAQAVIAMENARLLTETREARDDAESALRDLKAAQANLIQAEKMASLGQLTAGIAHEIKNPLNFVNNFASLSNELLEELKEEAKPALATLDAYKRAGIDETMVMLSGNLEKIAEHGQRADNIVKSMLQHSRGASGERREVGLNGLIEEALNLAYHGARARDTNFNVTLERDYAASLKPIELAPQEMTRVFLNLFGNGFYAATKQTRAKGEGSFRPVLSVATREVGDAVEVRVRDNGTGISPEIRDKLFQPFFTTKPTGEGTGLGLSISYDIVTQQHGGTITVESEPGSFTEFTVRLPRH